MNAGQRFPRYEIHLADSLRAVGNMFRRRWLTMVLVTAIVAILGVVAVMMIKPEYQATARVQIDPGRDPESSSVTAITGLGTEAIETEVSVLRSEGVARAVVRRLNLDRDADFAVSDAALDEEERIGVVARKLASNLSVARDRLTYIINVSYRSHDPHEAAAIANAVTDVYMDSKVGARIGTAQSQADYYQRQLETAGSEVRQADVAAANIRAAAGIIEGSGSATIIEQQIAPLSNQLATAEASAAQARAALAVARERVASGNVDSLAAVRESANMDMLVRQRAELRRDQAEISTRYGTRHPEMVKIREQLDQNADQIRREAEVAVASLRTASEEAEAKVSSLRRSMSLLQEQQRRNIRAASDALALDRVAQTKREAYNRVAERAQQSAQNTGNTISQAAIVDAAVPPTQPTSPNRPLLMALALVFAVAAGSATVTAQELLMPGIRSTGDFERKFGIRVLSALPRVKERFPADMVIDQPGAIYAESLRVARVALARIALKQSDGAAIPRSIAVSSALPAEGKTTTSLSLARILANKGTRVLLVDFDFRRAALRKLIPPSDAPGTVEVLEGSAGIEEALIPDRVAGLDLIRVNEPHFAADALVEPEVVKAFLARLSEDYEVVLLDLPPIMGLADSRVLAASADATIMVVRWGTTPGKALEEALRYLHAEGANVLGAIFTMVPPSAEAMGGLYYSRKFRDYYQNG